MIRHRLGRFATILTSTAMLLAMAFAAGPAAAANPSWDILPTKLPNVVGAGHNAGYLVTIVNNGPSNINDLSVTVTTVIGKTTLTAQPTYFSGLTWNFGEHGSCINIGPTGTGTLTCDLGTLVATQTATFTVAYHVPTGSTGTFDAVIAIQAGTGNTDSDPTGPNGGHSRGDKFSKTASTGIVPANGNVDAGFSITGDTYQTGGSLGRNNKQTTQLVTTDDAIPVTITDGVTTFPCDVTPDDTQCLRLIGEWSVLDVNGGTNDDPIKVTLMVWGGSVPGGVGVDDIFLVHADGTGGYTTVDASCDGDPQANADCLESVTKVGSNFKVVAWLSHNGAARGGW